MKKAILFLLLVFGSKEFTKGDDLIHVAILTEEERAKDIELIAENFTNFSSPNKFSIHVVSMKGDGSDFMSLLRQFSKMHFLDQCSFIILDIEISTSFIESLLGQAKLLIFDIRNRRLKSPENHVSNLIMMKPSFEEQERATDHLLQRLGFKSVEKFDNCIPTAITLNAFNPETIYNRLHTIKLKQPEVILIKCPNNITDIFKQAKRMAMTDESYKWVIPEILPHGNVTSHLPGNVMGLDIHPLDVSNSIQGGYRNYLKDSFVVIKSLVKENKKLNEGLGEKRNRFTGNAIRRFISQTTFHGQTTNIQFTKELIRTNPTYEIYEVVTMSGDRHWLPVGSWSDGKIHSIFMPHNNNFSAPRNFRIVTYYGEPWVWHSSVQAKSGQNCHVGHLCKNYTNSMGSNDNGGQEFCCSGFMIDFLLELETMLKFTAHVHFVKDLKFGSLDHNQSSMKWSGMVGELVRGEADVALHLLTITAERLNAVAFSQPYMEASLGILVSSLPASHSIWEFVFLDTFSVGVWLTIFAMCFVVVIVIWVAEKLRVRRRSLQKPHKSHRVFNFSETLTYTWSLAFQKAAEELGPTSVAGRVLAGLFAACAIITCSSFTANLAAIKVTERRGISISGIYDSKFQNPDESFQFSTLIDSAGLDYFRRNVDPALQKMARYLERDPISNFSDATEKLEARQLQAFIGDIPILKTLAYKGNCDLQIVGQPFFFSGYGLAYSKNFRWRYQFSLAVLSLQEQGFFEHLVKKWIPQHCSNQEQPPGAERLGLNEIGGALVLLAFGGLLGGLLLAAEYCVCRFSLSTPSKNQFTVCSSDVE